MPPITLVESFFDDARNESFFDFVHPVYKVDKQGNPLYLLGTCFAIAPGLYMTAAHIFDAFGKVRSEYKALYDPTKPPPRDAIDRRCELINQDGFVAKQDCDVAILILDQAALRQGQFKTPGLSYPNYVIFGFDHDFALLFVWKDNDLRRNSAGARVPIAGLNLQEHPTMGQSIIVAGFPRAGNRYDVSGMTAKQILEDGLTMVVNEGTITEFHPEMRDSGIGYFPCMNTSVTIQKGHSGGPAMCKDTLDVVGINSIGGIGVLGDRGLISWIGKFLDIELDLPMINGDPPIQGTFTAGGRKIMPPVTLRRLAEEGLIRIHQKPVMLREL